MVETGWLPGLLPHQSAAARVCRVKLCCMCKQQGCTLAGVALYSSSGGGNAGGISAARGGQQAPPSLCWACLELWGSWDLASQDLQGAVGTLAVLVAGLRVLVNHALGVRTCSCGGFNWECRDGAHNISLASSQP